MVLETADFERSCEAARESGLGNHKGIDSAARDKFVAAYTAMFDLHGFKAINEDHFGKGQEHSRGQKRVKVTPDRSVHERIELVSIFIGES